MQHTVLTQSFVDLLMDNGLREFNKSTKIFFLYSVSSTSIVELKPTVAITMLQCIYKTSGVDI